MYIEYVIEYNIFLEREIHIWKLYVLPSYSDKIRSEAFLN